MKASRLEELYRRRLVPPREGGKVPPMERILSRPVAWHPAPPDTRDFDVLEIGPGRGDFLIHLARLDPDKRLLAVEAGGLRYAKLARRIESAGRRNITLARADARALLTADLRETSFGRIYVLFPDPWPRNRHRHRRLLTREFTGLACARIKPGGEFTLATDVADYADWVVSHLKALSFMEIISDPAPPPGLIPTFFEKKWREMGRTCSYVRAARNSLIP